MEGVLYLYLLGSKLMVTSEINSNLKQILALAW